jgi:hypothetical protein
MPTTHGGKRAAPSSLARRAEHNPSHVTLKEEDHDKTMGFFCAVAVWSRMVKKLKRVEMA